MRVKIFSDRQSWDLDDVINMWFSDNPKVIPAYITQSGDSRVTISIWYYPEEEGNEPASPEG